MSMVAEPVVKKKYGRKTGDEKKPYVAPDLAPPPKSAPKEEPVPSVEISAVGDEPITATAKNQPKKTPLKLGKGAYGSVYTYGEDTVIKKFLVEPGCGTGICLRENEILSKIKHPFIVKYKGVHRGKYNTSKADTNDIKTGEVDGGIHILMEQASTTLNQRIKDNLVSYNVGDHVKLRKIKYAITQILLALEYLHYNNIIHRDISAVNVLYFNEISTYKLCDFGMWRTYSKGKCENGDYVNVGYRAPEMFTGQAYDHRLDIWSAGVILYTMLVGYNPMHRDDADWIQRPYDRAALMIEHIPSYPTNGIGKWVRKMRGIRCVDHVPTAKDSDTGEIMFMNAYNKRKEASGGAWSTIKDKDTVTFLSRMLTWHIGNRATATQLLDDIYLKNEFGDMISSTRSTYLKKNIFFPATIYSPGSSVINKLLGEFGDTMDALPHRDGNASYSTADMALGIELFYSCYESLIEKTTIQLLFFTCMYIAYKYNVTNATIDHIKDSVTSDTNYKDIEALESIVLEYFNYNIGRYTIYDAASNDVVNDDKDFCLDMMYEIYFKLKKGLHNTDEVYKKSVQ